MKKIDGVSIIVPVYNEEDAIVPVVDGVLRGMRTKGIPVQIVVVNDGSTDRSEEKIISEFGNQPEVFLVSHKTNKGVGIARNTGIQYSRYEWVGMIDADETYPAEAFPQLVEKMLEYDMVVGTRRVEHGNLKFFRRMTKAFLHLLAGYLFDTKIPDLNSGMRVFKKGLAFRYLYLLPPGHSWVSTITLSFLANGHSIHFFPIEYYPRKKGRSSFHPLRDTYNYLLLILRVCTYFNPLKIFAPLFLFLFLIGGVKTMVDVMFFHGIQESDIILLVSALLVLVLGLVCDLIVTQGKKDKIFADS